MSFEHSINFTRVQDVLIRRSSSAVTQLHPSEVNAALKAHYLPPSERKAPCQDSMQLYWTD